MQLAPQKTLSIVNGFSASGISQWYINNAENDPTIETSALITTTTYPLLCTDQTKFFNASTVTITVPSTCSVTPLSKRFTVIYTGTGSLSFTGPSSGDLTSLVLYKNQAAIIEQYTSGAWFVASKFGAGIDASLAGAGTATFAVGAGAGTTPGTPVCATSHVCDSLGGIVSLTMGTATPTTGVALTVTTGITRTNQPDCEVKMWLQASPFTTVDVNATTSTTAIGFNLTGVAAAASTAYFLRYGPCHGN
jgi:hypothetical protein